MDAALKNREWTAEAFVQVDQHEFGPLWRYELIDGRVVGHAAASPDHGAIIASLATALLQALRGKRGGCRVEVTSAAIPRTEQRNTARIPDVMIRCGEHPTVAFEVISQSELRARRAWDRKRRDLQAVEGMREIVEIFQDDYACHVYRLEASGRWSFDALAGPEATLSLESVGVDVRLGDIYEQAPPDVPEDEPA